MKELKKYLKSDKELKRTGIPNSLTPAEKKQVEEYLERWGFKMKNS